MSTSSCIRFGSFRFEPSTARLWKNECEVRITRKAASVLALLVDRAGQPVTKLDLFKTVWGNTVVGDDALVTCIQELRKALGDDAKQPRFIETRHRSGYRFIAEISQLPETRSEAHETQRTTTAAIAVLPFTDVSPDHDQDYFCEGLAEELIDALTQVDDLRVVARSSSFQFRSATADAREVGRRLGVGALLDGSIRKAGERLRIVVRLIDVDSGYHTWSKRFDRGVGDVFAVQGEIADAVVTTLRGGALTPRERIATRRPQTSSEPYDWFLRGRQRLHRMQQPDMDESRAMFEHALELDAKYAPAWAGLATAHALLFEWWGARDHHLKRADRASLMAMELAPELADAHVARGCALALHRQYDDAQRHFDTAARINPHLFDAYYYAGRAAFAHGHIEQSVDMFRRASEVRQEDFQSAVLLAQSLRMLGRSDEAAAAIREGVARAERTLLLNPCDGRALALGSHALYYAGNVDLAMTWSRRSLELYPDDMSALINAVCLQAKAGHKEKALDILERVFSRGWGKGDWIDHDPDYNSLRDDPRFERLRRQLG